MRKEGFRATDVIASWFDTRNFSKCFSSFASLFFPAWLFLISSRVPILNSLILATWVLQQREIHRYLSYQNIIEDKLPDLGHLESLTCLEFLQLRKRNRVMGFASALKQSRNRQDLLYWHSWKHLNDLIFKNNYLVNLFKFDALRYHLLDLQVLTRISGTGNVYHHPYEKQTYQQYFKASSAISAISSPE